MKMKIAISGSTGLLGKSLWDSLSQNGHELVRLVRRSPPSDSPDIFWDIPNKHFDAENLNGFDVLIHLAGENIASGRWTAKRKTAIYDSRVIGTKIIADSVAKLSDPPKLILSASAIGFYGPRKDQTLDEQSTVGTGFLADLCEHWESSLDSLKDKPIRVCNMRIGIVLSKEGGALGKMLLPFKMGVGGVIGSGKQYMSWITLDDCVRAIIYLLENQTISGPVNLTAPNPTTNREFTKTFGCVLKRPTLFPLPAFMAKLVFGEMAQELLLQGQKVIPTKLLDNGFEFNHPNLEPAFQTVLSLK